VKIPLSLWDTHSGRASGKSREAIVKAPDGVVWIRTSPQKTGVPCNIPLLDIPVRIIEKYRGRAKNGALLSVPSNSILNKHLKTVAENCGVKRNLIFHMARHNNLYLSLETSKYGCISSS
jgi:hypothetical protein